MMVLVTGGSASGKSAFAEKVIETLKKDRAIYLATMIPWDEECREKIAKHRTVRAGKGYETLEQYTDIASVTLTDRPVLLLECLSNLLANEMYDPKGYCSKYSGNGLCDAIISGVNILREQCEHVVIVTNEVFSDDGSVYEETMSYLKYLGEINRRLTAMADNVYEIVSGLKLPLKEEEKRWDF